MRSNISLYQSPGRFDWLSVRGFGSSWSLSLSKRRGRLRDTVGIFKERLFDDTEFLADFDEGGDGFVEVLALVGG